MYIPYLNLKPTKHIKTILPKVFEVTNLNQIPIKKNVFGIEMNLDDNFI